ncbi:MAG: hypothetical protein LBU32_20155 [Clostridiales bacterium]|nr:hypothetical protein [Clostridiales bacterium]
MTLPKQRGGGGILRRPHGGLAKIGLETAPDKAKILGFGRFCQGEREAARRRKTVGI